jgi:hypothetical protein
MITAQARVSPNSRSCSAQESGSAFANPATVRSAGAVPSMSAAMIRGEVKASDDGLGGDGLGGEIRRHLPAEGPVPILSALQVV